MSFNQTEELVKHILITDGEFMNVNESEYEQYVRVK